MSTINVNTELLKETFYSNYEELLRLDPQSPEYINLKLETNQLLLRLSEATQ